MLQRSAGGRFLEVFLFTLSSLVLYHIGIGVGVFLIPLQVVASRRGENTLLAACGLFLLVFLALRFLPFLGGQPQPDVLTIVEILFVLSLLLGLVIVNLPLLAGQRTLFKLLGATAIAGLAAIPLAVWLAGNAQFQAAMGTAFSEVSRMLTSLFTGKETTADPALAAILSPGALMKMSSAYLSRSLLAFYFALLSFSWWAGQTSASRAAWAGRRRFHFAEFHLEGFWLWPLIASWALVLLDLFLHVQGFGRVASAAARGITADSGSPFWIYCAWNVGLVILILYGLQGLSILRFLFEKHGLPRLLWLILLVGLIALAASPKAGLLVIVALPAFGVSENWIRYRIAAQREPNASE